MRYVTGTRLEDWKFTQMRPAEMMNTSHNNVSGKQGQRENEISQVDRNPTFPTCVVGKRCHR